MRGRREMGDVRQSPRPNLHRAPLEPPLFIHQLKRIQVLVRSVLTLRRLRIDVEVAPELMRDGGVVGLARIGGGRGRREGGADGFGREGAGDLGEVPVKEGGCEDE